MKTLQKYFWQLLSTFLSIAAIFATYNVFFLQKPEKELELILSQPISLVDIKPEAESDIQVLYKNQPVSNLYLYQLQIVNSGNQPILKDDFITWLTFKFPDGVYVADDPISTSEPPNVGLNVVFMTESDLVASGTLLNPGDKVTVRFVLVGDGNEMTENMIKVDGRIVGVKEFKTVNSDKKELSAWQIGGIAAIIISILSSIIDNVFGKIANRLKKRDGTGYRLAQVSRDKQEKS
jgi:hypothetical protein